MRAYELGALAVSLLAACGGSVEKDDREAATTSGSGGASSSSATATSTGSGAACAGYDDQDGMTSVTVTFRNESPQNVYLPASCGAIAYSVVPAAGPDGTSYTFGASCLQTCADLQIAPPAYCGACAEVSYLVPPGGSMTTTWDGTGIVSDVAMPIACYAAPEGANTCQRIVAAPAGAYTFYGNGYASCGDGGCSCDANGACQGTANGQTGYADASTIDFPGATSVEIVFGVCAFGCPDTGAP